MDAPHQLGTETASAARIPAPIDSADGKRILRKDILATRSGMPQQETTAAAEGLAAQVLALPELASADTVAAYVSVGREPGTQPLLDALHARGTRVLLPVLLADNDLDWAVYTGRDSLHRAGRGLLEPAGDRLGPLAVTQARMLLLPGLAVDRGGVRLGRGGGSYDRVLTRVADRDSGRGPWSAVLLYRSEVLTGPVPAAPHDRPVHLAVTPSQVHRFE